MAADRRLTHPHILKEPGVAISYVALSVFLLFFIVGPLVVVFLEPGAADWARVWTTPRWRTAIGNTLSMAFRSTATALLVGLVYAIAIERGNFPGKRIFELIPLLLLVSPPFVGGLAFIFLLGRSGLITSSWLGLEVSLYGRTGLWIAQTLSFFPVAFMILRSSLQSMGGTLDNAARGLGAGRTRVLFSVTIPLLVPGMLAAALFIGIIVLADFANPLLIGGRYRVLATEVFSQLTGWADSGMSAALGIVLLLPAAVFFALQQFLSRRSHGRYVTVGGRSSQLPQVGLPAPLRILLFLFCLAVAAYTLLTFFVIFAAAVVQLWGINYTLTLDHVRRSLRHWPELRNSLVFALSAAALCTLVSSVSAYLVHRCRVPFRTGLDLATLLPAGIPGTLYGVALVTSFARWYPALNGTALLIILAMAASYIPVGYRISSAALQQMQVSLDDGARNLGAHRMQVFRDITVPLTANALFATFAYAFIRSIGTVSAVVFLVSFDTMVSSVIILNLAEQSSWGRAAALASMLVLITFAGLALVRLISGTRWNRMFTR
ncbi:MAG: iron ABC transporter permease [Spirochaetaceae bacterium]|nr:MAG: iron ABC transporter permease [Spirochaetaceae bacterium]